MYEFATIALLGLAVCKLVDLVGNLGHLSRAATITLAILMGVGLTWLLDYNVYAGWSQSFRKPWMGAVGTGSTIAAVAARWRWMLRPSRPSLRPTRRRPRRHSCTRPSRVMRVMFARRWVESPTCRAAELLSPAHLVPVPSFVRCIEGDDDDVARASTDLVIASRAPIDLFYGYRMDVEPRRASPGGRVDARTDGARRRGVGSTAR